MATRPAMAAIGEMPLILLIGGHAQRWHLGAAARGGVTATLAVLKAGRPADIVAAAGQGGGPQVSVYDAETLARVRAIFTKYT